MNTEQRTRWTKIQNEILSNFLLMDEFVKCVKHTFSFGYFNIITNEPFPFWFLSLPNVELFSYSPFWNWFYSRNSIFAIAKFFTQVPLRFYRARDLKRWIKTYSTYDIHWAMNNEISIIIDKIHDDPFKSSTYIVCTRLFRWLHQPKLHLPEIPSFRHSSCIKVFACTMYLIVLWKFSWINYIHLVLFWTWLMVDEIRWKFTFGIQLLCSWLCVGNGIGCLYDFIMMNVSFDAHQRIWLSFGRVGCWCFTFSLLMIYQIEWETNVCERQNRKFFHFDNLDSLERRKLSWKVCQRFGANYYYW